MSEMGAIRLERIETKRWLALFLLSRHHGAMSKRPAHVKPPAYLSKSPPVPKPAPLTRAPEPDPDRPDPVRYGDWELKGIAVDF